MLEQHVLEFFTQECPTEPGDKLLVAVSGGPDSVALLYLLLQVRDSLGVELQAAHLNHKLRGEESENDARFVAELCAENGLTLHSRGVDVPALHQREGGSLEALARRERYGFLEEARAVAGARWIVTGHHADDQAETFLLNMIRGAGPRGLGGMLPVGPGSMCRPLLDVWREEIEDYLEDEGIGYRLDSSNADLSLTRNRVRGLLVPLLDQEFGSGVLPVLVRESQLMSDLDDFLTREGERVLRGLTQQEGLSAGETEIRLPIPELKSYHRVVQRSAVRSAMEYLIGGLEDVNLVHIDTVLELMDSEAGTAEIDLPRGIQATREYTTLVISAGGDVPTEYAAPEASPPLQLGEPGELRWGPLQITWKTVAAREMDLLSWANHPDRSCFDLEALQPPVYLRGIRSGDRIEPLGMDGRQKLSDLLINRKVPRRLRTRVAVLCDNGGPENGERILWVVRQRRARHAPIRPETAQVVLFEAETIV